MVKKSLYIRVYIHMGNEYSGKALVFTSGALNDNTKINGFSIFHVMILCVCMYSATWFHCLFLSLSMATDSLSYIFFLVVYQSKQTIAEPHKKLHTDIIKNLH